MSLAIFHWPIIVKPPIKFLNNLPGGWRISVMTLFHGCLFTFILIVTVFTKDSEVKPYIDLINQSLEKPINESLSKFLSEEENWNKFLTLKAIDPEGIDAFGSDSSADLESLLYKGFKESFVSEHSVVRFLSLSIKSMDKAFPEDPDNKGHALSSKISIKNYLVYLAILCTHLKSAKKLEEENDIDLKSEISDIKDPKIYITYLHDLFKKHLLNEAKWSNDIDFFKKLKSAAEGTIGWDTRTKVLVFGGIALGTIIIISVIIIFVMKKRKSLSLQKLPSTT